MPSPRLQGPRIELKPPEPCPVMAPVGLGTSTTININNQTLGLRADDLEVVCELGRGAYGDVHKMRERLSGLELAVKRIRYTMNSVEQRRTAMDLDVAMRSLDCPFTVHFYGAMFRDGDVWMCMEVMDTCLDRLYRTLLTAGQLVPETGLRQVARAVVSALHYLHSQLRVIHRDVKPSNILASTSGKVKLCDFGISAYLVDSLARTRDAGTGFYLAPERIEVEPGGGYSVKADVWSLGVSLLEVAQGRFPYPQWNTPFDQLRLVVEGPPPRLDPESGFSATFQSFLSVCLQKEVDQRATYTQLLEHPFLTEVQDNMHIGTLVQRAVDLQM